MNDYASLLAFFINLFPGGLYESWPLGEAEFPAMVVDFNIEKLFVFEIGLDGNFSELCSPNFFEPGDWMTPLVAHFS
jgi:hypothetical protein